MEAHGREEAVMKQTRTIREGMARTAEAGELEQRLEKMLPNILDHAIIDPPLFKGIRGIAKIVDAVDGGARKIKIALDFDGVLHSYKSGYTGPIPFDAPVPGAQVFCQMLIERGYELSIFTTRAHPLLERGEKGQFVDLHEYQDKAWEKVDELGSLGVVAIRAWFKHYGFPEELQTCEITHKKVHADLFVDDRGFRFTGDFNAVLNELDLNPECRTWTGAQ